MNYRTATILAEKALAGAGTENIAILLKDVVSRIRITWRTAPSQHGMDSYVHRDITKIELVDGSDVLFSMDGGQAQALNIYNRKCPTMNYGQHMSGDSQLSEYGIDFGRFLYDRELALDPTRFANLQLRISYDVDVSDTGVTTGYLAVFAEVFDERRVTPVGFLMAKEHINRTPPASGYFDTELPTDYPIRTMLIQGYLSAYEPWYVVSEARLDENGLAKIPFDWDLETYYRMSRGSMTPVEELFIGLIGVATKTYFVTPTDYWMTPLIGIRGGYGDLSVGATSRGGSVAITCAAGGGGVVGIVRGYLPNHCFEIPFGEQQDLDDWYDVPRDSSRRLRLKAGTAAATGTAAVVLQQLRRG